MIYYEIIITLHQTYCKICQILYSQYVPIKLLIANKFRLLFTYNADSIRYLISLWSLLTYTESVVIWIIALNRQIVNNRLYQPLKPGIWKKHWESF